MLSFVPFLRRGLLLLMLLLTVLPGRAQRRTGSPLQTQPLPLPSQLPLRGGLQESATAADEPAAPLLQPGMHLGGYAGSGQHFRVEPIAAPPTAEEEALLAAGGYQPQPLDIAVSDSSTTYLVFAGGVSLVDVGMMDNYLVKIEANAVFVRARRKSSPPTPVLVRYGTKYWMGRLVTVKRPVLQLYDFTKPGTTAALQRGTGTYSYSPGTGSADSPTGALMPSSSSGMAPDNALAMDREASKKAYINAKLRRLDLYAEDHQSIAVLENKLSFGLSNVRNDKDFTYLRFKVVNASSIDYKVDFVDFQLVENAEKKFLSKKKNEARRPLTPSGGRANQVVKGNSTGYLYYAVPLFAATDAGHLRVALRELNGARALVLPVPSRIVNTAPTF